MKALILAAGEGTRLCPLTLTLPKPMLPVGEAPLLAHILRWLRAQGITETAINLFHLPESIAGYAGDGSRFGMTITYSREDPILGSAGAAKKLEHYFESTFLVVYGDMLLDVPLAPLLETHRRGGAQLTMGLMRSDDPGSVGIAEIDDRGQVARFVEKPRPGEIEGNLAAAGVYIAEPAILRYIPEGSYSDFGRDVVPRLLREGILVYGQLLEGYLLDIGTPEAYRRAQVDVITLGRHWGTGGSRSHGSMGGR